MTAEVDNFRSMVYNSFMNDYKAPELKIIAHAENAFTSSFAAPRQSGLVKNVTRIVFEPEFCKEGILNGIDEFSHLWILWLFSGETGKQWSPTVRPPKLGGNRRKAVFATRSPFRPNPIGLSSVKLEQVVMDEKLGPTLIVSGADLMDGTPILDIKPYLPYADSHPDAAGSFAQEHREDGIEVDFPTNLLECLPEDKRQAALAVLEQDPRAAYNKKADYVYGLSFAGYDIRFTVGGGVLTVIDVVERTDRNFHKVK